jgi:transcriptional regulator CtsR
MPTTRQLLTKAFAEVSLCHGINYTYLRRSFNKLKQVSEMRGYTIEKTGGGGGFFKLSPLQRKNCFSIQTKKWG